MNRYWISILLICSVAVSVGCADKCYVRQQVTPIVDKVNRLDDETAKNTNEIKEVDARIQQSIQAQSAPNDQLSGRADSVSQQTAKAQQTADGAARQVANLASAIANHDNYRVVNQVSVHFEPDKDTLSAEAAKTLDDLGSQLSNARNYIITVEGGTDSLGNKEYNYDLSDRRADQVVRFLAAKYNVPAFKVHVIGLGEDKPVAPNDTPSGRAQNRRADVQMLSGSSGSESVQPGPAAPSGENPGPR